MSTLRYFFIMGGLVLACNLIAQSQKVGINTTEPQDILHVQGGILAQGAVLVGESTPVPVYQIDAVSSLTDSSGILYDSGGPTGDYANNESFTITINPPNPAGDLIGIRITVDSLDTVAPEDYLRVSAVGSADTLSGNVNGHVFTTSYTFAILKFVSDASNTSAGFKVSWNGLYLSPDDTVAINDFSGRFHWISSKQALRSGYVTGDDWDIDSIGKYSTAMGKDVKATGESAVAFGEFSVASGKGAVAFGINNIASGGNALAMGNGAKAKGSNSISIGFQTHTSGVMSASFGNWSKADASHSFVIGRYNVGGGNASNWFDSDPLFEIGYGTSDVDRANAMMIRKDASALWTGEFDLVPNNPPASGAGTRMMWYPDKAAFRAGHVGGTQWDGINIGNYSTAIGQNTWALGESSVAMGNATMAFGANATALGLSTNASGMSSTALGSVTTASGSTSTALGSNTTASGNTATALGSETIASGVFSTALGRYTRSESRGSVAMGRYNIGGGNAADWIDTDPLFEIGIGTSTSDSANALTVLKNGNVGLGTHLPTTLLHLKNGTGSGDPTSDLIDAYIEDDFAYLEFSGDPFGGITFKDDGESVHAGVLYNYQSDELEFKNSVTMLRLHETGVLSLTAGGKLGIGTTTPASLLHIKNSVGAGNPTSTDVDIVLEDVNAYMEISATGTSGYTFKDDGVSGRAGMTHDYLGDRLYFRTNGIARLNILDNGNVGIGTITPFSKLHVEGTIEVDQRIKANDSGGLEFATDEGTIRMKVADNGNVGIGTLSPSSKLHVLGHLEVQQAIIADNSDGIGFATDEGIVRMKMTDAGNIGIGTTSPTERLHVAGGFKVDGTTFNVDETNKRIGIGTSSPSSIVDIRGNDPTVIIDNTATTGNYAVEWQQNSVFRGSLGYSLTNNYMFIYEDGTVMVQNGNLGVGVTSIPAGHKLEVNGGAYCDGSTWTNSSSRALKDHFTPVTGSDILNRLAEMDIPEWSYRKDNNSVRHIGPMAEDFHVAFGLGMDNTSISTVDISGVALAAIQELNREKESLKAENVELRQMLLELSARVQVLENN